MGEKLIIGPINKGLKTDVEPFNIDNDSFPTLINAYQWRKRVKRKRGTQLLNRLQRKFTNLSLGNSLASPWTINTIYSSVTPAVIPETNSQIVPGSVVIRIQAGPDIVFTDQGNGTLTSPTGGNSGTINYLTGVIVLTHTAGAGIPTIATFSYYPALPVMGLEDLTLISTQFPGEIAFDTKYSYNIPTTLPYTPVDVSFYKNPGLDATNLPAYIRKAVQTPLTWNGQSYQQFWTTNYQGALWATNGIQIPFDPTNVGMQFSHITAVGAIAPTTVDITVTGPNLVVGDFVFLNEFDPTIITGINDQSGYVIAGAAPGVITVKLPFANMAGPGGLTTSGIVQYLTNRSSFTIDNIRWYDGDPTNNGGINGWVNFMPPLSLNIYSIAGLPPAIYYLVGARMIIPFKDRLLFLGPVVQTSLGPTGGVPIYLQDTIIYSQNGTPYYTSSFTDGTTNYGINVTIPYHAILVPINQTATPFSYFADNTGFGGFVSAGVDQPLTTASSNEDALIVGFSSIQTRLIYSGNDIVPFSFYLINSEYGSASTFSAVNLDQGVITRGTRGFIITDQTSCQRFDTEILDQVFEISLQNNGNERFCAQRDYIDEWIYFTYLSNQDNSSLYIFPNQTLQYNYREQTWGIFNETYTTYGQFRKQSGDTWLTIKTPWNTWNEPWDAGETTLFQTLVIAGNQQGFIMVRNQGTAEDTSLYILNIVASTITSPDHGLNNGDFIIISNVVGTVSAQVNGKIFQVTNATQNTFQLDPGILTGTYLGAGLITRLYVPFIQSKQFPQAWGMGRKTRIGVQQYLFSTTQRGQIQLLIFLSQDIDTAFNDNKFVNIDDTIYNTTLYTCPESTNLGLTPANVSLQIPTSRTQKQTWHRLNTSLIGDTVQFGITLSELLMRQFVTSIQTFSITGVTKGYPTILTLNNPAGDGSLGIGSMIQITGVLGMTQLNNNLTLPNPVYQVISSTDTTATINVDSTAFTNYTSGGLVTVMEMPNQETEIEFHGAIIDMNPSQLLV